MIRLLFFGLMCFAQLANASSDSIRLDSDRREQVFRMELAEATDILVNNPLGDVIVVESPDEQIHMTATYEGPEWLEVNIDRQLGVTTFSVTEPDPEQEVRFRLPPGHITITDLFASRDIHFSLDRSESVGNHSVVLEKIMARDMFISGGQRTGLDVRLIGSGPILTVQEGNITRVSNHKLRLILKLPPALIKNISLESKLGGLMVRGKFKSDYSSRRSVSLATMFGTINCDDVCSSKTYLETSSGDIVAIDGTGSVHAVAKGTGSIQVVGRSDETVVAISEEGNIYVDDPEAFNVFATALKGSVSCNSALEE